MSFNSLSFDELDEQVVQKLVFDEEEMSPILKGHIFIERILETLISNNLSNPKAFFKRTWSFDLKVDLALATGLIDGKYFSAFKAINKVRNNYAHKHEYKVAFEDLSSFKFEWEATQNEAFNGACTKGSVEAARIATIFLCWKAIHLIKKPNV